MFDRARTIGATLVVATLVALAIAMLTRGGSDAPSAGAGTATSTTSASTTTTAVATTTEATTSPSGSGASGNSDLTPAGCELIPTDVLGVILGDNVQASQAPETNPAVRQCFFVGVGGATLSIRVERMPTVDKAKALAYGFKGSIGNVAEAKQFDVGLGQLSCGATRPDSTLFLSRAAIASGSTYISIDVTNASSETSRTNTITAGKALLANSWVKGK